MKLNYLKLGKRSVLFEAPNGTALKDLRRLYFATFLSAAIPVGLLVSLTKTVAEWVISPSEEIEPLSLNFLGLFLSAVTLITLTLIWIALKGSVTTYVLNQAPSGSMTQVYPPKADYFLPAHFIYLHDDGSLFIRSIDKSGLKVLSNEENCQDIYTAALTKDPKKVTEAWRRSIYRTFS